MFPVQDGELEPFTREVTEETHIMNAVMKENMTDSELQRGVLEELKWEPSVNAAHIGVSVKNGVVTLSGHVPSYWEKYSAEKAAKRVYGVRAVANELDVKLPGRAASAPMRTSPRRA
jgi:osmotically-inducible protein OsmY